ncbi:MAG TPA: VWA domain-containing protein [Pyrinomonadaceae bacterium]|nr:VWA domain-containing protein [Pyrinomonadaceae bacterium]
MTLVRFASIAILITAAAIATAAQSRHAARGTDSGGTILTVTAKRTDGSSGPIRLENIYLYENGIEHRVNGFSYDPSPSRIVLIVDNSLTLAASTEKLSAAVMEFAYEIYDGDQLFVIAYDEKPEIIQEWTDSADKMKESLALLRKAGNPYLFDAIGATLKEVLQPLMPGTRKTAVVVIGDGLDRGSDTSFDRILADLQMMNVTVYALQLPDRTGGAYRRNQPKAAAVINKLTEETGGLIFPLDDPQAAAKAICDELRQDRYLLSYLPLNTSSYEPRRLLLLADEGIKLRTKTAQPPNIK